MAKIIAFEGIECSGKSTAILSLHEEINAHGFTSYVLSKQESDVDKYLRAVLKEEILLPQERLLTMYVRFLEKQRIILEQFDNFDFILVDRYDVSMRVFAQSLGLEAISESIFSLTSLPIEVYRYVFCHIDFAEFCERDGLQRIACKKTSADFNWFIKNVTMFDEFYQQLSDRSIVMTACTKMDKLRGELFTDMY